MRKSEYIIEIKKRIGNTNNFEYLKHIHVYSSLWSRIKICYKEKGKKKSEILNKTDFGKRLANFIINNIKSR